MNIIEKLEKQGYEGLDASLDISLFEYGMIGKKYGNGYHIIFVNVWREYMKPASYDSTTFTDEEIEEILNYSWFDKEEFLSYVGQNESDWLKNTIIMKLSDMINYYGVSNILGDSYVKSTLLDCMS